MAKLEPRDWIAELNQIAANEVDRAALVQERKRWPLDLMGGMASGSWPLDNGDRNAVLRRDKKSADRSRRLFAFPDLYGLLSGSLFGFAGTIDEQAGNDATLFPIVLSKDVVEHTLGNHAP